ncbi:DUF2141 domain-containing protein [Mangrovivirga cuniculi]|uniref:DUF2141 domain-containing protein n=1 Tax=Mangrovivirga cuniculi TaxID=2715131 RepID=A0A4D7JU75_9BACT|nr:DUF2141 domain-containing protein [Mangrovivirga cuniculi]QCK14425.1 hypothetical protein DCC35_06565 [Mangrovivirga cuniculi]
MKQFKLIGIGILLIAFNSFAQEEKESINITLKIEGIKAQQGQLMIRVFNTNVNYPDQAFRDVIVDLKNEQSDIYKVENLPAGDYAIIIYQDLNSNNNIDIGMMGPEEPLGYSNNASNPYGPAPYESAKMSFQKDRMLTVTLK